MGKIIVQKIILEMGVDSKEDRCEQNFLNIKGLPRQLNE